MRGRLTVGQQPLELYILVRVQASQQFSAIEKHKIKIKLINKIYAI